MKRDGDSDYIMMLEENDGNHEGFQHFYSTHRSDFTIMEWYAHARTEEHAVKIVNEKRAYIIANNCWGDDEKTNALFNKGGGNHEEGRT